MQVSNISLKTTTGSNQAQGKVYIPLVSVLNVIANVAAAIKHEIQQF